MNRQSFWRWLLPVLAGIGMVLGAWNLWGASKHPLAAGPMLQDVRTDAATVVWWGDPSEPATLVVEMPDGTSRRWPAKSGQTRFEVRVDGLLPSTTYEYGIETGAGGSAQQAVRGKLRTAPLPGASFSFFVFGDSGSGKLVQYRLARAMMRHPVDLVLHTGDLVYRTGDSRDYPRKFHRPYRQLLAAAPFYPVLGNHDVRTDHGRPFLDTFSLPTNGPPSVEAERCYWFDYGDARFVAIDSTLPEDVLARAVAPWIKEVLSNSPLAWKFVFLHEPPWAGAYRPPNIKTRDILVPAIEAVDVDVVFCGHNHIYERTHPMRAGRVSPDNGVLYIVSGAGGKSLYKEKHGDAPHMAAYNNKKYSFTRVQVSGDGDRLDISQISADNQILDSVTLCKSPVDGSRIIPN